MEFLAVLSFALSVTALVLAAMSYRGYRKLKIIQDLAESLRRKRLERGNELSAN